MDCDSLQHYLGGGAAIPLEPRANQPSEFPFDMAGSARLPFRSNLMYKVWERRLSGPPNHRWRRTLGWQPHLRLLVSCGTAIAATAPHISCRNSAPSFPSSILEVYFRSVTTRLPSATPLPFGRVRTPSAPLLFEVQGFRGRRISRSISVRKFRTGNRRLPVKGIEKNPVAR